MTVTWRPVSHAEQGVADGVVVIVAVRVVLIVVEYDLKGSNTTEEQMLHVALM